MALWWWALHLIEGTVGGVLIHRFSEAISDVVKIPPKLTYPKFREAMLDAIRKQGWKNSTPYDTINIC